MGEVEKITPVLKYLKVMLGNGFEESRSSNQYRASGGFRSRTDSSGVCSDFCESRPMTVSGSRNFTDRFPAINPKSRQSRGCPMLPVEWPAVQWHVSGAARGGYSRTGRRPYAAVEPLRLGFVVCLIFETFVAAVHAVVGASTREPRIAEKHRFSIGKIR